MADRYPKSIEELTELNAALLVENERLQRSVGTLQAAIVMRDAEIAGLKNPKRKPHVLDPQAKDSFARPFRGR